MNTFDLYQQLADANAAQSRFQDRDRFLVLAIDAAQQAGKNDLVEQWRQRLLQLNPHHLLKPYSSYQEAVQSPNFSNYLNQLRRNFPPNTAQELLNEMSKPAAPSAAVSSITIYPLREDAAVSSTPLPDPLAHVPMPIHKPVAAQAPYQLQPARPIPITIPPPTPRRKETVYSHSGALIGNVLFVLLLGLSLAVLGYVVVWPLLK